MSLQAASRNLVISLALVTPTLVAGDAPDPGVFVPRHEGVRHALAAGDTTEAMVALSLAIQDDPLDGDAHIMLSGLLARKGERDQAVVGFQRAALLDPNRPEPYYNLGTLMLARGEPVQAARLLEAAAENRPDYVPAYNNLGKAYFQSGLPELALASYERALEIDPANEVAARNLALLAARADQRDPAAPGFSQEEEDPPPPARGKRNEDALQKPDQADKAAEGKEDKAGKPPAAGAGGDLTVTAMEEILGDLENVRVGKRGGRLAITGWTEGPRERSLLDKILAAQKDILDLTTSNFGDPHRMIEVDATLFVMFTVDSRSVGFNFLDMIQMNFDFFATDHTRDGQGYGGPGGGAGAVTSLAQQGWIFEAAVAYDVNIANAAAEQVAVLARPHLTTLSGTPATFISGGEFVFKVSGINSGNIKPYPFGTTLNVTPTLLRSLDENGNPRIHVQVDAGRTSILELLTLSELDEESVIFDKVNVTSEAVLNIGQTLILSGLNQREQRTSSSGVPILKSIPVIKLFFSSTRTVEVTTSVIILVTPRDPAFVDERYRAEIQDFVDRRRAYVEAAAGGPEEMEKFKERYPDWYAVQPNRFGSHFNLMQRSELYRSVMGSDLTTDDLDFDLLKPATEKKEVTLITDF